VSGKNNAFSYNQASEMDVNFYENIVLNQINERGFVSPLANNAFLFYNYRLEGVVYESELMINKIRVNPKRKSDPTFTGLIYIIEDSWRIHSLELLLTKNHQLEFIDSLKVNKVYTPVNEKNWLIFSQSLSFLFKILGFKGSGYFIGVTSNYEVNPVYDKKHFDNEVIFVEEKSNKRDSSYWAKIRPIPLTFVEEVDYRFKDSLRVIKESRPYMDSVDNERNKLGPGNIFISGYTFRRSFKKQTFSVQPLTSIFQFNTVEGLVTDLKINYRKSYEDHRNYRITPEFRYGFSNEKFNAQFEAMYYYRPKKFSRGGISFGRFVKQFNASEPISPLINSVYTLFEKKNFMKLYQNSFLRLSHRSEIKNGLMLTSSIEYEERKQLQNSSDFHITGDDNRQFTPNIPINQTLTDTSFPTHQAFIIDINLRIRINQQYISRPYQKINLGSKYPTLHLSYRKGLKGLGAEADFDKISLQVVDNKSLGLAGWANFRIEAGTFLNDNSTFFMDFKHFKGNLTSIGNFDLGNFQLLDYYFLSTTNSYLQAHFGHHFNGFIFNKFPLLRKLKPQAVFTANYLNTKEAGNYLELGVGIEHILKFLRIDFFTSFDDEGNTKTGFIFGLGF